MSFEKTCFQAENYSDTDQIACFLVWFFTSQSTAMVMSVFNAFILTNAHPDNYYYTYIATRHLISL